MIVRPARPSDAEGLAELGQAVGSEPQGWLVSRNGWRDASDERRYLRAIRRYPNAAVYVAEQVGLGPESAGWLVGSLFNTLLYFLPPLAGTIVDRYGFKRSLMICFAIWVRSGREIVT